MKNDMGICLKGWQKDKIGLLCYTAIRFYLIGLIETKKALFLQRMCTYATGKGHEKSRGLIAIQPPAM
ncbi:MAG: hypothetical protein II882_09390 [Lachnospiraceae bacterium]|nr:hypothetical protein [Lachnospiraceae bacterium]